MSETNNSEFERRMHNWRLWRLSERGLFVRTISQIYQMMPRTPGGENTMPILAGEAAKTDKVVFALPASLRRVVEIWYLAGGTVNEKRKMLGCRRERMFELLSQARTQIERLIYE